MTVDKVEYISINKDIVNSVKASNKPKVTLYKYNKGVKFIKYPPKNNIVVNIHITTILAYSAKKKNTKITAACSVMNPLTNSDSASAKSKGALLVSAIQAIKKTKKIGNKGNKNQTDFWASKLEVKFKLPVNRIMINIAELNINS
jgi:hypothetical protein